MTMEVDALDDLEALFDGELLLGSEENISMMEAETLLQDDTFISSIDDEMNTMEQEYTFCESRNSHKQQFGQRFRTFLATQTVNDHIETMAEEQLAKYLRTFYYSLRRKDGQPYKPATLICIRAGISNYLNDAPLSRNIDILNGAKYKSANNMLKSLVGYWMKNGKEGLKHHDAIEKGDLEKMYKYFDRSNSVALQDEVWYALVTFFGNRGREGMRGLTPKSLEMHVDSDGRRYYSLIGPERSKTVKPSLSRKEFDSHKQGRLYESGHGHHCFFTAVKLYLEKLKGCQKNSLFPKPCTKSSPCKWYQEKQVLGKDLLGNMLPRISEVACLSKRYTNHCVRSTYITTLKDAGFKNDEVCVITGHKNERSIERYDRRKDERTLGKLSDTLADAPCSSSTSLTVNDQVFQTSNEAHKYLFSNCTVSNCTFN